MRQWRAPYGGAAMMTIATVMKLARLILIGLVLWWLLVCAIFLWVLVEREIRSRFHREAQALLTSRGRPEGANPRGPRYL